MGGDRFLFDNNMFDDNPLAGMKGDELESLPEFSKKQLKEEKIKAYEAGQRAGFKDSEAKINKATLDLLQKINRDMSVLFAAEDDRMAQYEGEALHLSLFIIKKLFPLYTQEHGEEELKTAIKTAISAHDVPTQINIEMHGDILQNLETYIKDLEDDLGKKVTLRANNDLKQSQCNILWPSGGIICNRQTIAEKTFIIMKETLAERDISVHDDKDNEQDNSNQAAGEI